jgi:hypothetical protein
MKRITIGCIIGFAIAFFAPQLTQAQGTLYMSSLSGTATGNAAVGSDSWLADEFGTGPNSGGYMLDSIQVAMADASGNPNGIDVMIYTQANIQIAVLPGSSLGTLTGSANPATAGIYNYTSSSPISLSPMTVYFVVLTSSTTVASGAYNWTESAYPPSVNSWGIGNGILESNNGTSGWSSTPYLGIPQFAIYATPAPEPGVVGLFALGGLLVGFQRRRVSKN